MTFQAQSTDHKSFPQTKLRTSRFVMVKRPRLSSLNRRPQSRSLAPACDAVLVAISVALVLLLVAPPPPATAPFQFIRGVEARPYILLNNPRPKCIEVKSTEGINVVVTYEAPDLVALDGLEDDGASDAQTSAAK